MTSCGPGSDRRSRRRPEPRIWPMPSPRCWRPSRATSCRSRPPTALAGAAALADDVIDDIVATRHRADERRRDARGRARRRRTAGARRDRPDQAARPCEPGAPQRRPLIATRIEMFMPDGQDPSASDLRSRQARARRPRSRSGPRAGKRDGRLPLRSHAAARRGLLDRHAAADGQRLAARRPRLLLHAHRRHRALPAHARQGRVLSDGMGRQRPADRAPRAELLRRALRSVAAVRPGVRAAGQAGQAADPGVAPELHRALHPADGRRREGLRAPVALSRPVGRLVDDLRDDRPPRAARVAAGVPAPAAARRWPISSKRRRCGTSTSAPPSRRPSSKIASSRAPITGSASRGPTAAASSRSTRRGPS